MRRSTFGRVARRTASLIPALAGWCVVWSGSPALAQTPLAPGEARICFYRLYEPWISQNLANIDIDALRTASVANRGPALCRDVTPGTHQLGVENYGVDPNAAAEVRLGPGGEAFVKIVVADAWLSGGAQGVHREAFSLRVVSHAAAAADLARPR